MYILFISMKIRAIIILFSMYKVVGYFWRKLEIYTVESFIFVGLKFRGFQISDKLVGI